MTQKQAKKEAKKIVGEYFSVIPQPDFEEYKDVLKTHVERAIQCSFILINKEIELLTEVNKVTCSSHILDKIDELVMIRFEILKM